MNIGLHIAEILEERGKVSVQGAGTFYLKKTDAFFDEQRQIFYPTDQKLSFKLFEEDNTIFPVYISKAEGIDLDAANQLIKKFAVKFSTELGNSGTTEIRGIGKLKKSGSEYTIETFSSYGLMPLPEAGYESSGISDFSDDEIIIEEIRNKKENIIEEEPVEEEVPPVKEEPLTREEIVEESFKGNIKESVTEDNLSREEPIKEEQVKEENTKRQKTPSPEKEIEREDTNFQGNYGNLFDGAIAERVISQDDPALVEEKKSSSLMRWLIIVFAALILIMVPVGYYFYPQIKELIKKQQATQLPVQAPVAAAPVIPSPVDSLADSTKTAQTDSMKSAANPVIKPDSAAAGTITYEIIIASFSMKSEAETYISQMSAKGQKVHLLERPLRTFKYKVSAGSFKDQAAAQNALSLVRKNINEEAWVDQIKN